MYIMSLDYCHSTTNIRVDNYHTLKTIIHNRFCKAHLGKKYFIHTSGTNGP